MSAIGQFLIPFHRSLDRTPYFSFGGWKKSAFGDLNQYGPDAFKFYTKTKTVTARWFSGIKDGVALNFKAMD